MSNSNIYILITSTNHRLLRDLFNVDVKIDTSQICKSQKHGYRSEQLRIRITHQQLQQQRSREAKRRTLSWLPLKKERRNETFNGEQQKLSRMYHVYPDMTLIRRCHRIVLFFRIKWKLRCSKKAWLAAQKSSKYCTFRSHADVGFGQKIVRYRSVKTMQTLLWKSDISFKHKKSLIRETEED